MGNRSAVKERKQAEPATAEVSGCRHHWIIESPHGALSNGRCKVCGEERQFRNSANDYIWDDDSSSGYGRGSLTGVRSSTKLLDDDEMTASPGSGRSEPALAV